MSPLVADARGVIALAVVALLLALVWALQRRLVYLPFPAAVPPATDPLNGAREVTLRTADGLELGAWFVAPSEPDCRMAVLVPPAMPATGPCGRRSRRRWPATVSQCCCFDYRGYGGNRGRPTEAGLARDIRAALKFLGEEAGLPGERLLNYGESLGAAVVTELATAHPPAGLVLRSPFVDLASVGRVHYPFLPVRTLLKDRLPLAKQLARVTVPTTVVYGSDDRIVPPDQSRAVTAATGGPTRLVEVEDADHNDRALLEGAALVAAVVELADRCAPVGDHS